MLPLLLLMIIIAALQGPPLVRNKQYRELAGFALVWLAATIFTTLVASQVPLPHLNELLEGFYNFIGLFE